MTLPEPSAELPWHVIAGVDLLGMLRRVASGEDPEMVYAEEYANAEHERVDSDAQLQSCKWCLGRGRYAHENPSTGQRVARPCPRCKGTGWEVA